MKKSYRDMTAAERAEHIAACQAAAKAERDAKAAAKAAAHAAYMAEPYHTGYTSDTTNQASRQAKTEREQAMARKAASDVLGSDPRHIAELDACDKSYAAVVAAMDTEPGNL